ncbi:unnamed protein product [Caretta caretta]
MRFIVKLVCQKLLSPVPRRPSQIQENVPLWLPNFSEKLLPLASFQGWINKLTFKKITKEHRMLHMESNAHTG